MANKGRWVKTRKPVSPYPQTEQQQKIAEAGRKISEECTGKEGAEFKLCRSRVLHEIFKRHQDFT